MPCDLRIMSRGLLAACKTLASTKKLELKLFARSLDVLLLLCCDQSSFVAAVLLVSRSSCCRRVQLLLEEEGLAAAPEKHTMNANTIKAAAKPLGMLAVRCAAPSQSNLLPAH